MPSHCPISRLVLPKSIFLSWMDLEVPRLSIIRSLQYPAINCMCTTQYLLHVVLIFIM